MSDTRVEFDAAPSGYRLSHVLRAHQMDVKCVTAAYDPLSRSELLLSASRDQSAACWFRPVAADGEDPSDTFLRGPTYQGQRYANAVAYLSPSSALPRGQVLLGSLDSQIRCFDPLRFEKPVQVLSEHWDNVSVISVPEAIGPSSHHDELPCFISGSWDKSARVWSYSSSPSASASPSWHCTHTLRTHQQAVWGAAVVERPTQSKQGQHQGGRYLTASADLFIRLFHGDQLHAIYAGHTDVVRSIVLLPPFMPKGLAAEANGQLELFPQEPLFASASNDGTVRVWSLDPRRSSTPGNGGEAVRKLEGHRSLVYDLAILPGEAGESSSSYLISSGEDATVRTWDWITGKPCEVLPQPAISVWSVDVLPRSLDIVAGLSDGTVRVYTTRAVQASDATSYEDGTPISQQTWQEHSERCKAAAETLDASQRNQTEEQSAPSDKELFESEWYDAVLRIDVSDDAEPLPLPINAGDDHWTVARAFVQKHNLPTSYLEEIVNFIALMFPARKEASHDRKGGTAATRIQDVASPQSDRDVSIEVLQGPSRGSAAADTSGETTGNLEDHPLIEAAHRQAGQSSIPPGFADFHRAHFESDEQRAWFASQLQSGPMPSSFDGVVDAEPGPAPELSKDDAKDR